MLKPPALPIRTLLAIGALCPALAAAARLTEVDVVVDFTLEGRKIAHPTSGNPAYYYPVLVGGFQELGALIAGEKPSKPQTVAHVVALELAKQGYLEMNPAPHVNQAGQVTYKDGTVVTVPAHPNRGRPLVLNAPDDIALTRAMFEAPDGPYSLEGARSASFAGAEGPLPAIEALQATDPAHGPVTIGMPSLILSIQMGYANPQFVPMPTSPSAQGYTSAGAYVGNGFLFVNAGQMIGLVAGNSMKNLDPYFEGADVMRRIDQYRYFVMLNAYDFGAYRKSRKLALLWQAKMSCPSDGVVRFADALTALVSAGGPYFGRETTEPKLIILPVTPEGHVEVGEPQVVVP